ncbi:MAG: HEPN domain-containing protein [Planctomycetes bacterium]|nr:HEPN domain-containing protein [Planctomycetota bacterium]
MSTRLQRRHQNSNTGHYDPNLVLVSAIRRYVRQVAERFQPEKIILFGSYAYGTPTPDSDVDLLVVMPARNELDQAARISEAIEPGFSLDLLVRTPKNLEQRLRWGDWFLKDVVTRGKVLYEKANDPLNLFRLRGIWNASGSGTTGLALKFRGTRCFMKKLTAEWLGKAENDLNAARRLLKTRPLFKDLICFLCQQAVEKYLKAMLQEAGRPIERTHDIQALLDQLIPTDKSLRALRRGTKTLTSYAVDYRYPGLDSTPRQARAALQKANQFREQIRKRLGLTARRTGKSR